MASEVADSEAEPRTGAVHRSVLLGVAVALTVAAVVAALVYALIAIPLYTLARADPHGLDRPFVRNGFFRVALPIGAVAGLACGIVAGLWYGRGGRLPAHRSFD